MNWHFKPEINPDHLLTTLGLIVPSLVAGFVWGSTIDKRIAVLETHIVLQQKTDARQDVRMEHIGRSISMRFDDLSKKLDRLIERELVNKE